MQVAQSPERRAVERGDGLERRAGAVEDAGDRLEGLAGQPQLAGPVDARVAGEHLLDQRGARAGQAEDEDGPARVVAGPGVPRQEVGVEDPDQPGDEPLVLGRGILAVPLGELLADGVGLAEAGGGAGVLAAGVEHVGQPEEQPGARGLGQIRVGEPLLQRREVRIRQLAAEQGRQPGVRHGEVRLELQRRAEGRLGIVHPALLLGEAAEVEIGGRRIGLGLQGLVIVRAGLGVPALLLHRPAQREVHPGPRLVREQQRLLEVRDRLGGLLPLHVHLGQDLLEGGVGRVELDGPLHPG